MNTLERSALSKQNEELREENQNLYKTKIKKLKSSKLQKLLSKRKPNVYYQDCSPFSHDPPGHTAGLPCCETLNRDNSVLDTSHHLNFSPFISCHSNFSIKRPHRKLIDGRPMFTGGNFSLRTAKSLHSLFPSTDPEVDRSLPKIYQETEYYDCTNREQDLTSFAMAYSADDFCIDPYSRAAGDEKGVLSEQIPDTNTVVQSIKSSINKEKTKGDSGISVSSGMSPTDITELSVHQQVMCYHMYSAAPSNSEKRHVDQVSNKLYDLLTEIDINLDMFEKKTDDPNFLQKQSYGQKIKTDKHSNGKVSRHSTGFIEMQSVTEGPGAYQTTENLPKPNQGPTSLTSTRRKSYPVGKDNRKSTSTTKSKKQHSSSDKTADDSSLSEYEDAEPVIKSTPSYARDNTISGIQIVKSPLQKSFSSEPQDDTISLLSLPPYPEISEEESANTETSDLLIPPPPPTMLDLASMGYKYPPRVLPKGPPASSSSLEFKRNRTSDFSNERVRRKSEGSPLKIPTDPTKLGYSYPPLAKQIAPPPVNRSSKPQPRHSQHLVHRSDRRGYSESSSDSSQGHRSSSTSSGNHPYDNALIKMRAEGRLPEASPSVSANRTEPTSLSDTSPDESDADLDMRFRRIVIDPTRRPRARNSGDAKAKVQNRVDRQNSYGH